jgi:sortase (surface protein transpeptidase)
MDVPKIPDNVAWFDGSALPGQMGNSVINGHLDSASNKAVFYRLRELIKGDELAITYENGDQYVFVVTAKERYYFDSAPMQTKILGPTPERRLNLITCDGAWDGSTSNYQQRLVVYTKLKAN